MKRSQLQRKVAGAIAVAAAAVSMTFLVASPASATTHYGSVNCTGGDVVGIWIDQSGNSGWGNWSSTGVGSADWNYDFNNNDYRIKVGCGGSPSLWQFTNTSGWTNPNVGSWDYICYNSYGICYKS